MEGYISLWRKIQNNPLWLFETFSRGQAWIDLLLLANHKPGIIRVRGNRLEVLRGEVGYSKQTLAIRWKWSVGKVGRFFDELENDGQITQKTKHKTEHRISSIITINNYEMYQSTEHKTNDKRNTNGTQTEHKRVANNNGNNVNNENNINTLQSLTAGVQEIFKIFYEINPTINFGNKTQRAAVNRLIKKLGLEKTIGSAKAAIAIHGKKYAPVITTPIQLENKLAELVGFYKSQENNQTIIIS